MSVSTIDNTLRSNKEFISSSKKISSNKLVKKKRKGKNTENDSVTITKKTKVIIGENHSDLTDVDVCSYQNCVYPNLTLENCGTSNYTKNLHHICQQNIDEAQYDGQFERLYGLRFSCSECIVELQKKDCLLHQ